MASGTQASMMESITVERLLWFEALIHVFRVSWTTTRGVELRDTRRFTDEEIYYFRPGVTPMTTGIMDYPDDPKHPCRLVAFAYLKVTEERIVARLRVRTPEELDTPPDDEFFLPGGFAESGPNIYPLPIVEEP